MKTLFSQKAGKDFEKLLALIGDIDWTLQHSHNLIVKPKRNEEYIGFMIHIGKSDTLFFGVWSEFWKKTGSPFILVFSGDEKFEFITHEIFKKYFVKNKNIFCDYILYEGCNCLSFGYEFIKNSKVEDVTRKIIEVSKLT